MLGRVKMRLRDYGNWVTYSSLSLPGEYKKEYGSQEFSNLLKQVQEDLNNKELHYAVFEFRKHGGVQAIFKINPAKIKHTIYVELYDTNPKVPIDKMTSVCTRSCDKAKLIEKLNKLYKEFLK